MGYYVTQDKKAFNSSLKDTQELGELPHVCGNTFNSSLKDTR